ncbi:MAG: hypothetical protein AAF846_26830 [Chloroflexota bacterium]
MIINRKTALGGASYPFLERLNQPWMIHSWDIADEQVEHYNAPIALRWVNGSSVNDLYIEDMESDTFLKSTALDPQMNKGGFVLSKRISRLMRPYFMYGFFEGAEISVQYLDQDAREEKIWDGAGQVRRSVLLRVLEQLPDLSANKRAELEHELRHTKRIEFTMMGKGDWSASNRYGQDKGHAVVFEDHELDADFVLPRDTKGEIKLNDGSILIGLYAVHHADTMRLDIQSLINLWGFFQHQELVQWLHEEGQLFLASVQNGDVARAMRRIDQTDIGENDEALEAIKNWHIREYLASGGDPTWFGSIVKGLINQHLKRINYSSLGRLRLPVPGGRYYVMTDEVGKKSIPKGHIQLDRGSSTAWVNADDWVSYQADVWGGADQDDALWIFPFTDYDGSQQMLTWRSPNQLGEYVVLRPTEDSHIPEWESLNQSSIFPLADSRNLPARIDTIDVKYLNLVDPDTAGGLGEWLESYSVEGMDFTIARAIQNKGTLGAYCNALILARALYNKLPAHPPAPLEDVIDGSVKTGTDLTAVKAWCYQASQAIVAQGKAIPARLQDRLSEKREKGHVPLIPLTSRDHWFDQLIAAIEQHIRFIENERDQLMRDCMPPIAVFNVAYQSQAILKAGAGFNQAYTTCLPWTSSKQHVNRGLPIEEILKRARERSMTYLDRSSEGDERTAREILLAAVAHYYSHPEHTGKDEAVWQLGAEAIDGTRLNGIAQMMLQALREVDVLSELTQLENGHIVRYPGARQMTRLHRPIKIVGVWFNYWRFTAQQRGLVVPERMQEVADDDHRWAKAQVKALANTQFKDMTLIIRHEQGRAISYTQQGHIFGYIAKEHTHDVPETITLRYSRFRDGNYLSVYS